MDKAKDALKGNDKAQGFADKQVDSRTITLQSPSSRVQQS
jgi:hypothetical protein